MNGEWDRSEGSEIYSPVCSHLTFSKATKGTRWVRTSSINCVENETGLLSRAQRLAQDGFKSLEVSLEL